MATVNALGFRVTNLFDAANRKVALVDARGNRVSFGYSKADQPVTQMDALNRVQTVIFDAASQPVVRIDARSFRVSQVFDNAGQMVGLRYPDNSRVTQVFDAVGNRRALLDSTGSYTTTFDALNRAHAAQNPALKTLTVTWDGAGRRRTLVNPDGGIVTYAWSKRDQCIALQNADGDRTSWTFDSAGRKTVQLLANGVRGSLAYDTADRLIRLANLNSTGTTLSSFRDSWDAANNRVNRQEADGTLVSWSYDASYQLTRERRSGTTYAYDTTYVYDAGGNRKLKIDSGARTTITLDAANQTIKSVAAAGTTTFSFDQNGNQRLEISPTGTTTNTWNFENRLVKVALPSGILNTFTFSGDGQRVQTQDSSGTLKQIYDGQKVLLETDQINATQSVYTSSPGVYGDLVSRKRLTVPHYHIFDPLGSTDRLVSSVQAISDTYIYKAFGESLLAGTTVNAFRYVGSLGYYVNRDTSDYHVRARWYPVALGRFASADPIRFRAAPNLYVYAMSNPLLYVDPTGAQAAKTYCIDAPWSKAADYKGCGCFGPWLATIYGPEGGMLNGFFVQRLHIYVDVRDCCGKRIARSVKCTKGGPTVVNDDGEPEDWIAWELFWIKDGKLKIGKPDASTSTKYTLPVDNFESTKNCGNGTAGEKRWEGAGEWYWGDVPPGGWDAWSIQGQATTYRNLMTCEDPTHPGYPPGYIGRQLKVEWNCCPGAVDPDKEPVIIFAQPCPGTTAGP